MYIHEAVKAAMKERGMISRETKKEDVSYRIRPTNSYGACQIVTIQDNGTQKIACRWNPTADDLMADDWAVIKE